MEVDMTFNLLVILGPQTPNRVAEQTGILSTK